MVALRLAFSRWLYLVCFCTCWHHQRTSLASSSSQAATDSSFQSAFDCCQPHRAQGQTASGPIVWETLSPPLLVLRQSPCPSSECTSYNDLVLPTMQSQQWPSFGELPPMPSPLVSCLGASQTPPFRIQAQGQRAEGEGKGGQAEGQEGSGSSNPGFGWLDQGGRSKIKSRRALH